MINILKELNLVGRKSSSILLKSENNKNLYNEASVKESKRLEKLIKSKHTGKKKHKKMR